MFLSVLPVLLQLPVGTPAVRPVRVTLDRVTVAPSEPVRVFVDVATPGHLLVLRAASDGRIEVVFPFDASEGTYVQAGSYEIRPATRVTAFAATEPEGSGVVLAAVAQVPYEFHEFLRGGDWDGATLAGAGPGTDVTGRLLDIVQRMLGPEYFHYDLAAYAVARNPATESLVMDAQSAAFVDGWVVWIPVSPCVHGRLGCRFPRPACDDFGHLGRCDRSCWDGFGCRAPPTPAPAPTAVALYRRGVPQIANPAAAPPAQAAPIAPRDREVTAPAGRSRSTVLSVEGPATQSPVRRTSLAVARREGAGAPPQAAWDAAALPRRVPSAATVVARGTRTRAPAVSPREARLKQSASRPPLPERVPWPTGATPPRSAQPMLATAKPIPATLAPQGPTPHVPRVTGAIPVARAGASGVAPASGVPAAVPSSAPARAARGSAVSTTPARSAGGARAYVPPPAAPASTGARASGGRSGKS
jgi:hypothetical protein